MNKIKQIMNALLFWLLQPLGYRKALSQKLEDISVQHEPGDRNFLLALKKAKQDAINPEMTAELRESIHKNIGKLICKSYKKGLLNKGEIIFIAEHEAKEAGIIVSNDEDGWLKTKTYIVNYLQSFGIKAAFYSDYVDVRVSDISKVIDSIPDSFVDEKEQVPPYSEGIYR